MPKLVLKNVRLSFPSLFETEEYQGQDTGKYAATFLVPKDSEQGKILSAMVQDCAKERWGTLKGIKFPIRDGDEVEYDGYEDMWGIKANTKRRPILVDRHKQPVTEEDNVLYPGCRVNASIEIFDHRNESYGKRVGCQLNGVQFCADDEPFGAVNDSLDDFDDMEDDAPKGGNGKAKPRKKAAAPEEADNPFA